MSSKVTVISVKSSRGEYPVILGHNLDRDLVTLVRKTAGKGRVFAVFDANLYALHGPKIEKTLRKSGCRIVSAVIPSGESTKSSQTVQQLYDVMLANHISRQDLIIACGGGVTSDVVGFAAATILRGVRWGICATTLLSAVDASIGGKTGINHGSGKNLIGAFWPPEFVVSDLNWLETLDDRQIRNGLGEVIKTAGLTGGDLLRATLHVVTNRTTISIGDIEALIVPCIGLKAEIVSEDEHDHGMRQWLNYGHTFAHAIEKTLNYRKLAHGETVILGMVGALALGRELKVGDSKFLAPFEQLVRSASLLIPRVHLDADEIYSAMKLDKKRVKEGLQFILLTRPGRPVIVSRVPVSSVRRAVRTMIDGVGRA